MNSPYAGPPPGYTAYGRPHWSRFLPMVTGAVALVGLACSLLPMWSLTLRPGDYGFDRAEIDIETGVLDVDSVGGVVSLDVGFYDWILSAAPVAAIMPIVFALTIAISLTHVLRSADHRFWGAIAASAVCAIALVVATAIRPQTRHAVTGPLARELSSDALATLNQPAPMVVGLGAGFALTIVALIAVGVLSGWVYVITSRQHVRVP